MVREKDLVIGIISGESDNLTRESVAVRDALPKAASIFYGTNNARDLQIADFIVLIYKPTTPTSIVKQLSENGFAGKTIVLYGADVARRIDSLHKLQFEHFVFWLETETKVLDLRQALGDEYREMLYLSDSPDEKKIRRVRALFWLQDTWTVLIIDEQARGTASKRALTLGGLFGPPITVIYEDDPGAAEIRPDFVLYATDGEYLPGQGTIPLDSQTLGIVLGEHAPSVTEYYAIRWTDDSLEMRKQLCGWLLMLWYLQTEEAHIHPSAVAFARALRLNVATMQAQATQSARTDKD